MLRFAVKTLFSDKGKLLTALVGVVFSLVLVDIQGGLFLGLIEKASLLVDHCDADIWVGHLGLENADFAEEIPEIWIQRIRGLPGVQVAEPYVVGKGLMTLPSGEYEDVWIIGSAPGTMLGGPWAFAEGNLNDLRRPNGISIERIEAWKLGNPRLGDVVEISDARAKITVITEGIVGFLTTPYCFTTIDSARKFSAMREDLCSYFLIKAKPGTDIAGLQKQIAELLPRTEVLTASELSRRSRTYWMLRTGIGISFGTATVLGLLVGLVMVAQSLYALVLDHIIDYGTLKAIGAEDGQVFVVVVAQSAVIAAVGIMIGFFVVLTIQRLGSTPYAPILIPPWLHFVGLGLVASMCIIACMLPIQRVKNVDPMIVLQG